MTLELDEAYEFSECAEEAIDFHWPDTLTPAHPLFERRMLELQLSLIECHRRLMSREDLKRALKTVREIKQRMKEL